jgi:hypothetical protein
MVTTTADLTVVHTKAGISVIFKTDDVEQFDGTYSNYLLADSPELPEVVLSVVDAYSLIHQDESFEITLRPVQRNYAEQGYMNL